MNQQRLLYVALGVLAVAGLAAADPLGFSNQGIRFPDGSLQTTAGQPAGEPVQDETTVSIPEFEFCSPFVILYTAPAGKRLVIEWIGVESNALLGSAADPVDIDIKTHDGVSAISHPLVRLDNSQGTLGSIFISQRWSSEVRLYGAAGRAVRAQACRSGDADIHPVRITFTGQLYEVSP